MIAAPVSIVIWYNPENLGKDIAVKNILTYANLFNKVYIIDNSLDDNSRLAGQIPNSCYIPNFNNLGIAKALNQGCEAALSDGYAWAMTMDQDSSWDGKYLSEYINEVSRIYHIDNLVRSFSPNTVHQKEIRSVLGIIKHSLLKRKPGKNNDKDKKDKFEYVDRVISSGNIIHLEMWKDIGGFNDALFINDVDYDFCYRAVQKRYKIVKIYVCNMYHIDGEPRKTFFPHAFWYHKERIYYSIRNKVFILNNYPNFAYKYKYRSSIRRIIFEKLFFFEWSDFKYIVKGISDGKKNKLGKYCNLS
jgi:rhamnosyltransferase